MRRLNKTETYPNNLIKEILEGEYYCDINNDMVEGLNFVIKKLNVLEREILRLRYEKMLTYDQIAETCSMSKRSSRNSIVYILRKLRNPKYEKYVRYGVQFLTASEKQESQQLERMAKAEQNNIRDLLVEDLRGITVRTYICLNNKGLDTIGKLIDFRDNNIDEWCRLIPNLTVQSLNEIMNIFRYVEEIHKYD